jgi:hypothetical protein
MRKGILTLINDFYLKSVGHVGGVRLSEVKRLAYRKANRLRAQRRTGARPDKRQGFVENEVRPDILIRLNGCTAKFYNKY